MSGACWSRPKVGAVYAIALDCTRVGTVGRAVVGAGGSSDSSGSGSGAKFQAFLVGKPTGGKIEANAC